MVYTTRYLTALFKLLVSCLYQGEVMQIIAILPNAYNAGLVRDREDEGGLRGAVPGIRIEFYCFSCSITEKYSCIYSQLLCTCEAVNTRLIPKKIFDKISMLNREIIAVVTHNRIAG